MSTPSPQQRRRIAKRRLVLESLESRRLLAGNPIFRFDFQTDQTLAQLQAGGWQVDSHILDDQDGVEDLRAVGGALELTDDDGTTAHRWAHEAKYSFAALENGRLQFAAGTGGSYAGNPFHHIRLIAGNDPVGTISLKNNTEGTLESGSGDVVFGDTSWKNEFRNYEIEWIVDPGGQNGLVSLSFEDAGGTVTEVIRQPFINNGVPDAIEISAGWSSPADTQLRIDWMEVVPGPFAAEIVPSHHHDIAVGAVAGDAVSGRVNLYDNVLANAPTFSIVGGTGSNLFDVATVTDTDQRRFGEIVVAPGMSLNSTGSYTLDIQVDNGFELSPIETITVHVVNETAASNVFDALLSQTRFRSANIDDATVADWMSRIQSDGSFSDLSGDHWSQSAARLGSLAEAYAFSTTYQGDATLKSKLYDAVVYWAENVTGTGGSFVNPAWAWPRQIGAVGYFLFADIEAEKASADSAISDRAWEVYDRILQGTESALMHLNNSDEHFWGGNLGYRLHSMQLRAALLNDYNRPLTYAGGFQRGFVSEASFADVQSLIEKSFQYSTGPTSVGLTEDGSFSQHVGGGAQLFNFGYGRDWASDVAGAAGRQKDTPWSLSQTEFDQLADYILDGMQWQVYNGQGDYLAQGRRAGKTTTGAYSNGDVILVRLIDSLVNAAGAGQLTRYDELIAARNAWDGSGLDLHGHRAMWNHDFVLQRTDQYYVSTKMNSVRSSGNETGNNNNLKHYHMGDGTTLVMLTGDEYVNARVGWDWHQLPGTTAETRTDALPIRNWNNNNEGLNDFAGVLSDGSYGFGAFINDRYDAGNGNYQYHTVNAK